MWYKVDWDRLILLLLPTFLRKPILFGFVKALIAPIASLHYKWELLRMANLLKSSYNGQKCYLRKALNDCSDKQERRIAIEEVKGALPKYIYTKQENLDYFLGVMYIDAEFNYSNTTVDFLVQVPIDVLKKNEDKIIATLEFYKLAGKKYQIIAI